MVKRDIDLIGICNAVFLLEYSSLQLYMMIYMIFCSIGNVDFFFLLTCSCSVKICRDNICSLLGG